MDGRDKPGHDEQWDSRKLNAGLGDEPGAEIGVDAFWAELKKRQGKS